MKKLSTIGEQLYHGQDKKSLRQEKGNP